MRASLPLLAALSLGCAAEEPPPAGEQCPSHAEVLTAPESGCTVIELEVAGADTCSFDGIGTVRGSWLRLSHAPGHAATLSVRLISTPPRCDTEGTGCPTLHFTRAGTAPCACGVEGVETFMHPLTGPFELSLVGPEQSVLLRPASAVYELSLCADETAPFPTCDAEGTCGTTPVLNDAGRCACAPSCDDDADCPEPRTGTVRARCDGEHCTLPCRPEDICPIGQSCVVRGGASEPICMTPP